MSQSGAIFQRLILVRAMDGRSVWNLAFRGIGSAPKICRSVSPSLFGGTLGSEFCVGNLAELPVRNSSNDYAL